MQFILGKADVELVWRTIDIGVPAKQKDKESYDYLKGICTNRINRLYSDNEDYIKRLESELDCLRDNNLLDLYVMLKHITWGARRTGYPIIVKGIDTAPLVAYLCEISKENPLKNNE